MERRVSGLGEKDITEKQLMECEDVFADIVNVLLFGGNRLIDPLELADAKPVSTYRSLSGKLRSQERDVAKLWRQGRIILAFLGLENQSDVSRAMPLRVIGYDGAAYRDELNRVETERGEESRTAEFYPVITLVLHFDHERRWTGPRTLKECFSDIPPELDKYVNDYKIHVVEVAWLDDETVSKFTSDFRYLADYYCQLRKTKKWVPMSGKVCHAKELVELFTALTGDGRFVEAYERQDGEVKDMSAMGLDYLEAKGRTEGLAEGIGMARTQSALSMFADHLPVEKVAKYSNLSINEVTQIGRQHGYL